MVLKPETYRRASHHSHSAARVARYRDRIRPVTEGIMQSKLRGNEIRI